MVRCWAAATVTTEAVACFPRQHVPVPVPKKHGHRLHHHTRLSQRKANVSVPLWLSKGEKDPLLASIFTAAQSLLAPEGPDTPTAPGCGQDCQASGSARIIFNLESPQAPSTKSHPASPSPFPSSPPREPSRSFFPDIFLDATSSRLLSSHSHSLSSSRTTRPESVPRSLFHPAPARFSTESVYDFYSRSHLSPIVERTLRHLYRRLFRPISPRPSLPLAPRPLQLRLRASTLAAMSSSDDDMPLSRTNGHGKSSTSSPCSTRHLVVLFPPSWHTTRDGTS